MSCRTRIGGFALALLRRHVGGRAHNHAAGGDGFILGRSRQPEIQNLNAGSRIELNASRNLSCVRPRFGGTVALS